MLPRFLSRLVGWAKVYHFYSFEIEERGESLWAFMRTWEKGTFRRVVVSVADRFAVDATHELSVPGSVVSAVGGSAVQRTWLLFLAGHMWWPTRTGNIWEVGTRTSWWSIPLLFCVSWSDVCRKCHLLSLGLWIPSRWGIFLSRVWRVQNIAIGWCPVPDFVVASSPESCRCRFLLRSAATSWECGLSTCSTSKRLVEKLTATA